MLPKALVAHQSTTLNCLVNGEMSEARDGFAKLDDVDEATFARFGQWLYTGKYEVHDLGQLEDVPHITELHAWDYGLSMKEKKKKERKMKLDGTWDSRVKQEDMEQANELTNPFDFSSEWSKRQAAWSTFTRNSKYAPAMPPRANNTANYLDLTEVLLDHAKLYCFADKYGIESLAKMCLDELRICLIDCECHDTQMEGVVELLAFTAGNAPPLSNNGGENLRSVVLDYFVVIYELVAENETFQELLERNGRIAKEFISVLRRRLD